MTVATSLAGDGPATTGVITLDRPRALNALDHPMISAIAEALDTFRTDPQVRQILIRSSSPKAFCAGGDVRSVRDSDLIGDFSAGDTLFRDEYDLNYALASFPKPVVALIDGIAMGGGLGISMHADHRVITPRAWASMPEAAIGFITDVGISHVFTHLPALASPDRPTLTLGWWLAVTAYRLTPGDLLWTGLATHLVDDAESFTERMVTDGVEAALDAARRPPDPRADYLTSRLATMETDIGDLFSGDDPAVVESRLHETAAGISPLRSTAALTLELMEPASPSSVEAIRQLLGYSAHHSLREALDAELEVGRWARHRPDFAEGVRAVLVDKTRDAVFTPATAADVTDDDRAGIRAALDRGRDTSAERHLS